MEWKQLYLLPHWVVYPALFRCLLFQPLFTKLLRSSVSTRALFSSLKLNVSYGKVDDHRSWQYYCKYWPILSSVRSCRFSDRLATWIVLMMYTYWFLTLLSLEICHLWFFLPQSQLCIIDQARFICIVYNACCWGRDILRWSSVNCTWYDSFRRLN